MCEYYCDRVYSQCCNIPMAASTSAHKQQSQGLQNMEAIYDYQVVHSMFHEKISNSTDMQIYFKYIQLLLNTYNQIATNNLPSNKKINTNVTMELIISLAEKYYSRLNSKLFLNSLPPTITVKSLSKYLKLLFEFENSKQRNLQVSLCLLCFLAGVVNAIAFLGCSSNFACSRS